MKENNLTITGENIQVENASDAFNELMKRVILRTE